MKNRTLSLLLCILMSFVFVFGFGCSPAIELNPQSSLDLDGKYLLLNDDKPSLNNLDISVIVSEPGFASQNEEKLLETFNNGHRIMFVDTTPDEVRETLNLVEQSVNHIDVNNEYLGSVAYKCNDYDVVVGIYVEDTDDPDMVNRAVNNAMEYDFGQLIQTTANSDAWPLAGSHSNSYTFNRFTVNTAMQLMLDPDNPTFSGQRNQVAVFNVDIVDVKFPYLISTADFDVETGSGSVVSYSPMISHANANTSISVTYPWGFGFSFSPGTSVDVSIVSGGLSHDNITFRYTPTALGPVPTDDDMCARMSVESYSYGNTAHSALGTFTITSCVPNYSVGGGLYMDYETVSRSMGVSGYDSQ